jgi:uncharacterized protein YcbX
MQRELTLSEIRLFPIKSLPGLSLSEADVKPYGLVNDRCMMLVDENGVFISQRKNPELALIQLNYTEQLVRLDSQQQGPMSISENNFTQQNIKTEVWGDVCDALVAEQSINQWFSKYLKQTVSLVRYNHQRPRKTDPAYSNADDTVSFADGFPLLVISEESLNDLNTKLEQQGLSTVTMTNFRPNVVIKGAKAFEEDHWKRIRIGEVEFDCVKICSRCILTTVDPLTGIKAENREPLKTLASYRKMDGGVMFGMNMIPRSDGIIRVTDKVEILE